MHIHNLPAETLWKIFQSTDDPYLIYKVLVTVSKKFNATISNQMLSIAANVVLMCHEDDQESEDRILSPPTPVRLSESYIVVSAPSKHRFGSIYSPIEKPREYDERGFVYCIGTRDIDVHISAIPPKKPETLVSYVEQLFARGFKNYGVRVVISGLQIKGRRGPHLSTSTIAAFVGALVPVSITLWNWDNELLNEIIAYAAPKTLKIPSMKHDGNIQRHDSQSLAQLKFLQRLEYFRPFPRQPWGIESTAFTYLSELFNLHDFVVKSGRLVGVQEHLVNSLCSVPKLIRIDTPWNFDSRLATRILSKLKNLVEFQFISVTSPDFWLSLPSFFEIDYDDQSSRSSLNSLEIVNEKAIATLKVLGLHYIQPDSGDFAVMIEGVIRCFPKLKELTIRVSKITDEDYDLFSTVSREYFERCFRRLEQKTCIRNVVLELNSRMWGSRKSYVDDLVGSFTNKLKIKVKSPVGIVEIQ